MLDWLLKHSRALAFRRRFISPLAFVRARFSPEGYLGLYLTLGALIILGAAWVFSKIAADVMASGPLTTLDAQIAAWLHQRATPGLTRAMLALTNLHSPIGVGLMALLVALYLLRKQRYYRLTFFLLTVSGGMLLNALLKLAFHRARPTFEHPILTLKTYSFPSGHTMAATVFYGMLAAFAVWTWRDWRRRALAICGAGLMILLVAFTRLYLGAHYLSDVLAAMALGLVWLALCLTAVDIVRRRRRQRVSHR